jgi:ABC-type oligopeptide transport system substrate-binding subunit
MDRTLLGILTAFAALLLVVGLTFSRTVDPKADFSYVNETELKTLDPQLATGQPEGRVLEGLFEGLTRYDAKTLRPVPGVAKAWDVTLDGLRYTFHLREDARWSDGRRVTARDFVYSWKRLLDPKLGSEYAYLLFPIRYAEAVNTFDGLAGALEPGDPAAARLREQAAEGRAHLGVDGGIYAPDDHTFVVELRAPTPYFLSLTAFHPALPSPSWVVRAHPDDWFLPEHIVSNGAFVLRRWLVNDRLRLEKNPFYWGKDEVRARSIDALTVENETTALNLYLTGGADWLVAGHYPTELAEDLSHRPDFHRSLGFVLYFYRFNTRRPPLDDRRVRLALNLAVDRKAIVDEVLGLGQVAATTVVPPGVPDYAPPESALGFDPARARALLAEAGFPYGKGFPEIGILYNTAEAHKKIAEVVADQFRQNLGIRANAYNQEWQSYQNTVRAGDYDLARAGWIGDYVDPNTFLDLFVTNGGNNQTGWSSPLYDSLIRTAADVSPFIAAPEPLLSRVKDPAALRAALAEARSDDPKQRLAAQARVRLLLLREAEGILVRDEFPILPVYFGVLSTLVSPNVRGFYSTLVFPDGTTAPNLEDLHPLRDLWVDRGTEASR